MDAGKRTINELFNGSKILEIPFFQRAYVWDEPQWGRLLEDLENLCRTKEQYFIGSVILKQQLTSSNESVGDVRTVIDGQQRLTTLSIVLKVLCLKNNTPKKFEKRFRLDDDRLVLQHNHNDVKAYNSIMDLEEEAEIPFKDNVSRAYEFFRKNLNPDKVDFETICHNLMFVGIDLGTEEDEQQIFDTINSLGVKLTTAELLKNYFFGRNDIAEYQKYWLDVFEKDEETREYWNKEVTTGRLKRSFIDIFFFSFLQIKIQESDVKAEDKIVFSRVERLFDSYKKFIKDYYGDKKSLLKEIKEYAAVFRNSVNIDIIERELPAEPGIERINAIIFALDTATLIPYLLYVEKNVVDSSVKKGIYEYLESYIMRRLITNETTKNYNQLFADRFILNKVLSKELLSNWLSTQDEKINRMPDDKELKDAFFNTCLINRYSAGVLYLIESKIRNRAKQSTQLLGITKYSLEHMMPKKWRNNWNFSGDKNAADFRDKKLLTLGNLTIITQSLNASIRDADWETKKEGKGNKGGLKKYAEGIETLSAYIDYDEWNEESINERSEYLAEKALEIWKK